MLLKSWQIRILVSLLSIFYTGLSKSETGKTPDREFQTSPIFLISDTALKNAASINLNCELVAKLPAEVKETSGLVFLNHLQWTLNDGGNPAELQQIDTVTGKILRTKCIMNAENNDWESLTQDSLNIYIGDFGNNSGNRTDLKILKIQKSEIINTESDTVFASFIHIRYPDQLNFVAPNQQTDFDCEAFFFYGDSLHLFTKNWTDQRTRHYSVPVDTGHYELNYIDSFSSDGLITDASINSDGNIVLLGYRNNGGKFWNCFCWVISEYTNSNFFNGRITRVELGSVIHNGQTEAIVLKNDNTAWISSESIHTLMLNMPAKLLRLDLNPVFQKSK